MKQRGRIDLAGGRVVLGDRFAEAHADAAAVERADHSEADRGQADTGTGGGKEEGVFHGVMILGNEAQGFAGDHQFLVGGNHQAGNAAV